MARGGSSFPTWTVGSNVDASPWLTTREAAGHARCHTQTVLLAARAGELVGYQRRAPHGSWRFKVEDLERWMTGTR
ncbi:helix-turn-helix domain-containing protein [Rhodococcus sp. 14-2496-1d]|uniref:helix-turn-helix domain-containing protein n=1 Tax=Rhodococcus sp. 14-2496-1d TaxID=2023146 RepID=UPI00117AD052